MAKDKEYKTLIHTSRWVELRHKILSEHPLCVRCEKEGYVTIATEVHHKAPVEIARTKADKERLMFDIHNLVPLCHDCHVRTHTEMGRSGKDATMKRNKEHLDEIVKKFF